MPRYLVTQSFRVTHQGQRSVTHFEVGEIVEDGERYEHAISQGWLVPVPVREPTGQMAFRVVRGFALGRTDGYEWRRPLGNEPPLHVTHIFPEGDIVYFEGDEDGPDLSVDPRIRAAYQEGWLVLMGRVLGVAGAGPTPSRVPMTFPGVEMLHTEQPMGPQAWAKDLVVSTLKPRKKPRKKSRYDFILEDDDFG